MMLARKQTATSQAIDPSTCIPAWNENTFSLGTRGVLPLHRNPVSRVLTRNPEHSRQASGPYLFQANQTDANECVAPMKFGTKRLWKETLHDLGVGCEIDQQPSLDCAFNHRNAHTPGTDERLALL